MSIDKIRNIGLDKLITQIYDFTGMTTDEIMCKFAQKINIIIEHFNYLDQKVTNVDENTKLKLEYLLGEGLEKEVAKIILKKIEDGSITEVDKINNNYFAQINTLELSETNTLIKFIVNKGIEKFPSFATTGVNLIVDDEGTERTIEYVSIQKQANYNILSYVCKSGDIRNKFTQYKLYQIL